MFKLSHRRAPAIFKALLPGIRYCRINITHKVIREEIESVNTLVEILNFAQVNKHAMADSINFDGYLKQCVELHRKGIIQREDVQSLEDILVVNCPRKLELTSIFDIALLFKGSRIKNAEAVNKILETTLKRMPKTSTLMIHQNLCRNIRVLPRKKKQVEPIENSFNERLIHTCAAELISRSKIDEMSFLDRMVLLRSASKTRLPFNATTQIEFNRLSELCANEISAMEPSQIPQFVKELCDATPIKQEMAFDSPIVDHLVSTFMTKCAPSSTAGQILDFVS
jgi:hypothetical protein